MEILSNLFYIICSAIAGLHCIKVIIIIIVITVVVLCVCIDIIPKVCVCMCVCHSYLPPHTLESQKRDTNGFCAIQGSFKILPIFLKMLRSKVMPTSSSSGVLALFSPRNKLLCWFEAYSYVFNAQTTGLWKTACDSLAQTRETAQIYGSRILIAPPTSAYTQYK